MFNSNDFLLSKIIDLDENDDDVISNMLERNNSRHYKDFRRSVSSLNLVANETFEIGIDESPGDSRIQAIKALMHTEATYLKRIRELLTDIFTIFEKDFDRIGRRSTMYQVASLFEKFPAIYDLHLVLQTKLKEELTSTKDIGNAIFEFLSQPQLLEVYSQYMDNFSNSLQICKSLKDRKYLNKHPKLMSLEAIVMSPIQRFPQLTMAIGDIYKHTPLGHSERVPLFKSVSILRSITARLDRQRREFEYTNFSEMEAHLLRLKLPFCSKQLLTNNSVFDVRMDFHIPRKITKIPYYLILYDQNVVMLPRDVPFSDLTEKITFCFSLDEIKFNQKLISNFRNLNNCHNDFDEVRNLYRLVNDSFSNDTIIKEYEALLNDYKIMLKLNDDLHNLNFRYKGIDTLKISKSMIQLEQQLKSKEIELNLQLGSILTLTIKTGNSFEYKKVYLFDSIRQSNEWKMMFNRAKLLLNIDMNICWKYHDLKKKLFQIRPRELPVLFEPFKLNDNGIIEINSAIVKTQSVSLVVGLKIYRCLWICLANSLIVILHFNYKQWMVLESFKIDSSQLVTSICISSNSYIYSPDYPYDSEIWMSCGDTVLIYSLLDNQRHKVKQCLTLPSEVLSLCNVEGKMYVALKSKKVLIYSKCTAPFWLQEGELSFKRFLISFTEELKEIYYGHGLVYALFKSKVIICKSTENKCSSFKVFESTYELRSLFITTDGVWVTVNNCNLLILYDTLFDTKYQMIDLPTVLNKTCSVGNITSVYMDDKYIWLGTENGFIISISTIDSLYCTDRKVPMYFSSMSSAGPITQIIPFQNIHGISIKCPLEEHSIKKERFDPQVPWFRRTMSNTPAEEIHKRLSFSCQDIDDVSNGAKEGYDSSSISSLQSAIENLRNTTPTLVIAFGSGIVMNIDNVNDDERVTNSELQQLKQPTLFTFLE